MIKMADVKWVKITTDMFDNRKIKHLRRLPDGNNIVLIWVMLLTLAGRCNSGGMIFLTENIPYSPKMLADELDFEESTVRLALKALESLGMVATSESGFINLPGWEEYQNVEGMEKIRESKRLAQARWRAKQKALYDDVDITVDSPVESTLSESGNTERDKEKDKIKSISKEIDMGASAPTPSPKKPIKHKYGEYCNVLLTDDELDKLKTEYPDWYARIERLSSYVASTGKTYKSHYATIRNWARKDAEAQPVQPVRPQARPQPQEYVNPFLQYVREHEGSE